MASLPDHTSKLCKLVLQPGGMTANEAVRAADAKLEGIRDRGLIEIAAMLARMHAIGVALNSGPDRALSQELYRISNSMVGIAGVFGLAALGDVAFSLCSLLDRYLVSGHWSMLPVQRHLDSLRLMQGSGLSMAKVQAVDAALRQGPDCAPVAPAAAGQ
jgi:hypothetical protein